ncbi:hypothetical protein FRB97_007573 [Tulasnella sp. 331]|nr:hypothetical protein FRB97_007573 [Tulasnella sp. 331]
MAAAPPIHQFSSQQQQQQQQQHQPPVAQNEPRASNASHKSSFFSFGRHKSSSVNVSHQDTQRISSNGSASGHPPPRQVEQQPPLPPAVNRQMQDGNAGVQYPHQQASQPPPPTPPTNEVPAQTDGGGASLQRLSSMAAPPAQPPPLHPELRSFVSLSFAHVHKIYFSGRLVRKIERLPDGSRPKDKDDWADVWGQLGGTTLSIWDMKEIEEANKQGREVPPSYVNVTDAFVSVLGSITVPAQGNQPPKRFTNVLTLNTAGNNLLLFACPDAPALVSWAAALRLAAWEKSRLEEIYTAHLLRMTLSDGGAWKEPRTTLVKGQMEGWAQIRVAGQTEWKRVWMVLTAATAQQTGSTLSVDQHAVAQPPPPPPTLSKSRRISNIFGGGGGHQTPVVKSSLSFYLSTKARDKKKPWMNVADITQVFAVYPERPEMISKSTLIKVEGSMTEEEGAGAMKGKEAWSLIMPEMEGPGGRMGVMEMLKWIVGFHDAFEMYGRPKGYTWDPRDPASMMFAYPFGPLKDHLFLDRELAETLDPRDDRTSVIRSRLLKVLMDRMHGPPIDPAQADPSRNGGPLPPLNMNGPRGASLLTPITERSSIPTRDNTIDGHYEPYGSPTLSAGEQDWPRNISTVMSPSSHTHTPTPSSQQSGNAVTAPTSATGHGQPPAPPPNGAGPVEEASISAPADPIMPTRGSTGFAPALPAIPGSAGATPPVLTPTASDNHQQQPQQQRDSPVPPQPPRKNSGDSEVSRGNLDSQISPQSYTRSAWNDNAPQQQRLPSSIEASLAKSNPEPANGISNGPMVAPGRNGSSSSVYSLERPPSFRDQPRGPSPLRTSSSGPSTIPAQSPSSQRITSPLAQSSRISATPPSSPPGPPPPLSPRSPERQTNMSPVQAPRSTGYPVPPSPLVIGNPDPDHKTTAPLSPGSSRHSYPAKAEVQNPDIYEPRPQQSRTSHTAVLNAPFLGGGPSSVSEAHGPNGRSQDDLRQEPAALYAMQMYEQQQQQEAQKQQELKQQQRQQRQQQDELRVQEQQRQQQEQLRIQELQRQQQEQQRIQEQQRREQLQNEQKNRQLQSELTERLQSRNQSQLPAPPPPPQHLQQQWQQTPPPPPLPQHNVASSSSRPVGQRGMPSPSPSPPPVPTGSSRQTTDESMYSSTVEEDGVVRRQTPMSFVTSPVSTTGTHVPGGSLKPPVAGVRASQVHLQRKPSGARAPPVKKALSTTSHFELSSVQEHSDYSRSTSAHPPPSSQYFDTSSQTSRGPPVRSEIMDDYSADALRALSIADTPEELSKSAVHNARAPISREGSPAYPSSFAVNKAAADRKAKAQAQQAATQAATMKPGRPNGKGKKSKGRGAWQDGSSDDEEEEEEEEDDDDGDSDGPAPSKNRLPTPLQSYNNSAPSSQYHSPLLNPSASQNVHNTPPVSQRGTPPMGRPLPSPDRLPSQQRGGRTLPHVPGNQSPASMIGRESRLNPAYDDGSRPRTQFDNGTPPPGGRPDERVVRGREPPPQLKHSVWSQALDPNFQGQPGGPGGRDTFVKVEDEAETMTKVFAPHGLLQAGLQDKHDRSAKRQEELARESGTSLINVAGKPLDPQTGLLGAVTAHERDRKREGGVGATLTRKLAEERMAEERQRKIDELQQQQLSQMSPNGGMYGGEVYGGQFPGQMQQPMMTPGFNPYMMNPMMMGNPMAMGGWGGMMGMNGMGGGMGGAMGGMGGMNLQQQQMMQAQAAAAEAYQRAMMTFSQAGSQAPSEAGDSPATPGSRLGAGSPMPGMGGSQSTMGYGFNPMMGPMGMAGMGGMGMGMAGMMGMGGWGGTPGQMSPASMASTPSVYPQQFGGAATPGSIDQHGRFSSLPTENFNPQDRSINQSRQSNDGPSQN